MFSLRLWIIIAAFVAGGYFAMHSPEVANWINKIAGQAQNIWAFRIFGH
jgi:hypothetical protein